MRMRVCCRVLGCDGRDGSGCQQYRRNVSSPVIAHRLRRLLRAAFLAIFLALRSDVCLSGLGADVAPRPLV